MAENEFLRARIIQRHHIVFSSFYICAIAIAFVCAQYLMMQEIGTHNVSNWFLPDIFDFIVLFIMTIPLLWGVYYRNKIGEVRFDRYPTERSIKIQDDHLQGEWKIKREGVSDGALVIGPILLVIGILIIIMALMTWNKAAHIYNGFQFFHMAETIQEFVFGLILLISGIHLWIDSVYNYRLYVKHGKTLLVMGIRVPMKR